MNYNRKQKIITPYIPLMDFEEISKKTFHSKNKDKSSLLQFEV